MAQIVPPPAHEDLSFSDACSLLGISSRDLATLRRYGLVACVNHENRQYYPRHALLLTARLLEAQKAYRWSAETLCWYADLAFASEIGRAVLLPLVDSGSPSPNALPGSWMELPCAAAVLRSLDDLSALHERIASLIGSLLAVTVGEGLFWADPAALRRSSLGALIDFLTRQGHTIALPSPDRGGGALEAGQSLAVLVLAFANLAPPISRELSQIVQSSYSRMRGGTPSAVPLEEQQRILREQLVAVDKLYAAKATEIHTPATQYEVNLGTLVVPKRTIALQLRLPDGMARPDSPLDNILDIIRPYLGTYGARVVQALYEIANDPPNWRSPIVLLNTNDLLDRLGEKRDSRGIHYSRNRTRLRDTLNAAHNLEIVAEYTAWEDGIEVRKAVRRPVISLIGATFDAQETAGITTEELFLKGLMRSVQVRLNFYDGVRRNDGSLGSHYVLMPRLADPKGLPKANHAGTYERLRQYLLFRYRQEQPSEPALILTREAALSNAGITNSNVTRATHTLQKALDRLIEEGIVACYTELPRRPHQTFTCHLTERVLDLSQDLAEL